MCNYQGYEFGAGSYPDSVCIDGLLFDADHCDEDGNLYDYGEEIPCPICNPKAAISWWYNRNFGDDGDEEESMRCAVGLVKDIRINRGYSNADI